MCLKFLAGAVVLVVVARSSVRAQDPNPCAHYNSDNDRLFRMIYDETIKLRQNISHLADELQIIDHEGLETGRITQLRDIPYPTELPECNSQEEFGELMESVQARLADSIQALRVLKADMHRELELEREFYNFESEANQLRDAIHCYLYRTSVWDLPAYTSYRMIDSQFDLPSYHTVEEMHFRNKHFANELHKYLSKTHESALSCYGHRSKRERATWIERELEKRAREILQSQLEPDAVELVSKRGWAPTWEDDLALGGEAYLPETKRDWAPNWEDDLALGGEAYLPKTKRDWATSYRFEDNVADQDKERLDQALTPQDTPQEVRYSQEDLEMAWHLLFGPVEEPKKRSAHASSWLANL